MNPYESGTRKLIPAVLIYARHEGRILMVHRNSPDRPGDYHAGKWNGLGGKLEVDESPGQGARREFQEESGLELPEDSFRCLGWLQFPNFKAHKNEDWLCFVFVADVPESALPAAPLRSPEGELHWVPEADLEKLNLWPGDREFLPYVLKREPFHGTIWYEGPRVIRTDLSRRA